MSELAHEFAKQKSEFAYVHHLVIIHMMNHKINQYINQYINQFNINSIYD